MSLIFEYIPLLLQATPTQVMWSLTDVTQKSEFLQLEALGVMKITC